MASTATLLKKVRKRGPINFEKAMRLTPTDFRVGGSYTKKDLDEFINNYSTNEKTFHDVSHFQATGKNADGRYYIKPQRRVSKSSVTTDNRVFSNPMDVSTRVGHVGPTSSLGGNAGNEASASSARVPVSSPKPTSPVSGGIKQFPQKKVDTYAGVNRNVGGKYEIEPYNREEALSRSSDPEPSIQVTEPPVVKGDSTPATPQNEVKTVNIPELKPTEQAPQSVQVTSKLHEPGTSSPEPPTTPTANSSTAGSAEPSSVIENYKGFSAEEKEELAKALGSDVSKIDQLITNAENKENPTFTTGFTNEVNAIIGRRAGQNVESAASKSAEPPVNAASEPTAAAGSKENPDNDQFGFGDKKYDEARQEAKDAAVNTKAPPGPPPDDYFDAGIGKEKLDELAGDLGRQAKAEKVGKDKQFRFDDTIDRARNFSAQVADLAKQGLSKEDYLKKLDEIYKDYGLQKGVDPLEQFKKRAAEDPTTWDWIRGNKAIEKAGGTLLLGGAVASCFSNKGRMSNSELYGQNF